MRARKLIDGASFGPEARIPTLADRRAMSTSSSCAVTL